jgi:hypothetical protein
MNCDRGDCNSCWTANPLGRTPKRERMRPTNSMDSCCGLLNRSMTVSERDIPAILATAKASACSGPSQTLIPAKPDAGKHHHAFVHSIGTDLPIGPDDERNRYGIQQMAIKMRAGQAPWMSSRQGGANRPWACRLQIPVSHTAVRSSCFACAGAGCTDFTVTTASRRSGHSPASSFAALPAYTRRCTAARSGFRCRAGSGRFVKKT